MKTLETQRLILREFKASDVHDFFAYAQNEKIGLIAGWSPHKTIEKTYTIIEKFMQNKEVWAIELKTEHKMIGLVGLLADRKRDNPESKMLGYELSESYWGKGYSVEAIHALLNHGFNDLNIEIVSVNHYPFNIQSEAVIKKIGFIYEGTLRQSTLRFDGIILDNVLYSLTKDEYNQKIKGKLHASN